MRCLLALVILLGTVSCDDGDEPEAGPTGTPTPQVGATLGDAPRPTGCEDLSAAQAGPSLLIAEDDRFLPPCFVISSTQEVQFANQGRRVHNFTIEGSVDVDVEVEGRSEIPAFETTTGPGTFEFYCKYHRDLGMIGLVIVE